MYMFGAGDNDMVVNIAKARANLSALVDAAMNGEEIILARREQPVARLVPLGASENRASSPLPDMALFRSRLRNRNPAPIVQSLREEERA